MAYWSQTSERPRFPKAEHGKAEVVVVGGGITGVTAAWLLAREGVATTVLEAASIGSGDTGNTTAHLTWLQDAAPDEIEKTLGNKSRLLLEAHAAAIDEIERLSVAEQLDCEFVRIDAYVLGLRKSDADTLQSQVRQFRSWGRECSFITSDQAPTGAAGGAIRVPAQAKFHPLKYLRGLARAAERSGARVFEQSRVIETEHRDGEWHLRTQEGASLRAHHLVIATHSPIGLIASLQTRLEPYRTYAVALRIPAGAVEEASYFDTADPYNYTRIERQEGSDLAIVGGQDHRTGKVPDDHAPYEKLADYFRATFGVTEAQVVNRWSGEVFEPVDHVAYVGRLSGIHPNRWVATGFSGNGMTHGVLSAMLLRDLIVGRENAWASILDPGRLKVRASAAEFIKTNLEVAKDFVQARLSRAEQADLDQIAPGAGRIVQLGGKKRAVYRKQDGGVMVLSPNCTHLGCLVSWNGQAESWECSCHGSRFAPDGQVISGPAIEALEVIHREDKKSR